MKHLWLYIGLVLASGSVGCLGLKPARDSTRHLLLSAPELPGAPAAPSERPDLIIGLAPVQLPGYLDSPWLAVRQGDNEIRYSGTDRWGERLDQGVRRVLAVQLGRLLAPARVEARAWTPRAVTWELTVEFEHCEVSADGHVRVEGGWRVSRPLSADVGKRGTHRVDRSGPPPEQDPAAAVGALSEALAEFARQTAAAFLLSGD
jgi:uncharacterized protein